VTASQHRELAGRAALTPRALAVGQAVARVRPDHVLACPAAQMTRSRFPSRARITSLPGPPRRMSRLSPPRPQMTLPAALPCTTSRPAAAPTTTIPYGPFPTRVGELERPERRLARLRRPPGVPSSSDRSTTSTTRSRLPRAARQPDRDRLDRPRYRRHGVDDAPPAARARARGAHRGRRRDGPQRSTRGRRRTARVSRFPLS